MRPSPRRRVRVPELERLKKQIASLEALLSDAGYDARLWRADVHLEDDVDGSTLGLVLFPKTNREIPISFNALPDEDEPGFVIDGNHWNSRFARETLASRLRGEDDGEED